MIAPQGVAAVHPRLVLTAGTRMARRLEKIRRDLRSEPLEFSLEGPPRDIQ